MCLAASEQAERRTVVLIVEDEVLVRSALAEELRDKGLQIVEARDADEAVRALEVMHIDAVFSDITMPGSMDGIELARWVRQHKSSVKVILTSGKGYLPSEVGGLAQFIEKPYRYSDIASRLQAVLNSN